MKKLIVLISIISVMLVLSSCGASIHEVFNEENIIAPQATQNELDSSDYTLYMENEAVQLWVNENTTEFKLVNKSDKQEWFSTNTSRDADSEQNSLLVLSYLDSNGTISTMNSLTNSVQNGQYRIEKINDDKLAVNYSIGDFTEQILVPPALTEERFTEISGNIQDEFEQMKLKNYYLLVDINNVSNETDKKNYLSEYPKVAEQPLYILLDTAKESPLIKKEVSSIFENAGYTKAQYEEDKAYFQSEELGRQEAGFNIQLLYTLESDGVSVEIPYNSIQMKTNFPLVNIQLLKYFGSPQKEDKGYFLLPDGSGSLMNFYNGKSNGQDYSVSVYGSGYAVAQNEKTSNYDNASLPVFGITKNNSAVIAEIVKGSAIANINAYPGDDLLIPYAYASFRVRETHVSTLSTGKKESFMITQKERYSGDIKIRYSILAGDEANYNGMARLYRSRLFQDQNTAQPAAPAVTVEYVGLIKKQSQVLGVPYNRNIAMTTFKQVEACSEHLLQSGITNMRIKLSGWFNGGYDHQYIDKVTIEKKLGGEKGLLNLAQYLKDKNIPFYPDADIQYTGSTGLFDGFSKTSDVITLINQASGETHAFNPASFMRDKETGAVRYIHNLNAQKKALSAVESAYQDYGFNGISLRSIGLDVNADFNEKNSIDREEAVAGIVSGVKSLTDKKFSVITEGANSFVLPYADGCLDVPLTSNQYDNTDETIPFLMMVLSGYVDYSGSALNLSGDISSNILRAASTGAGIYCVFTANHFDEIAGSGYTDLYSSNFDFWKESIVDILGQYQQSHKSISGQRIQAYDKLKTNVYKTTFEDGSCVIVNYSDTAVRIDQMEISAKSYKVLEA